MKPVRGRPDHEAESFTVKADTIDKPKKFYRNAKHNGNRTEASGHVSVRIRKQKTERGSDPDFRPENGPVLIGGEKQKIAIEAKRIVKQGSDNGQEVASVSKDGRIFGKLRRRP